MNTPKADVGRAQAEPTRVQTVASKRAKADIQGVCARRVGHRSGPRGTSFVAWCTSMRHLLPVDAAPLLQHADVAERATKASGARHDRPRSGGGRRVGLGPRSVHSIARTDHRCTGSSNALPVAEDVADASHGRRQTQAD